MEHKIISLDGKEILYIKSAQERALTPIELNLVKCWTHLIDQLDPTAGDVSDTLYITLTNDRDRIAKITHRENYV